MKRKNKNNKIITPRMMLRNSIQLPTHSLQRDFLRFLRITSMVPHTKLTWTLALMDKCNSNQTCHLNHQWATLCSQTKCHLNKWTSWQVGTTYHNLLNHRCSNPINMHLRLKCSSQTTLWLLTKMSTFQIITRTFKCNIFWKK